MTFDKFVETIKTESSETLDSWFDEITGKLRRARSPAVKLGYAQALDALCVEKEMRKPCDTAAMTDAELLSELFG